VDLAGAPDHSIPMAEPVDEEEPVTLTAADDPPLIRRGPGRHPGGRYSASKPSYGLLVLGVILVLYGVAGSCYGFSRLSETSGSYAQGVMMGMVLQLAAFVVGLVLIVKNR
jgi:hypothetical protein